jgi:hypothetical protein
MRFSLLLCTGGFRRWSVVVDLSTTVARLRLRSTGLPPESSQARKGVHACVDGIERCTISAMCITSSRSGETR